MLPEALPATRYILVIFYYRPWRHIQPRGKADFFTLGPAPLCREKKRGHSTIDLSPDLRKYFPKSVASKLKVCTMGKAFKLITIEVSIKIRFRYFTYIDVYFKYYFLKEFIGGIIDIFLKIL